MREKCLGRRLLASVSQPCEDAATVDDDEGCEELVAVEHGLPLFRKEWSGGVKEGGSRGEGLAERLAFDESL